ncbi:MAG: DUF1152 domain-containing protein [Solirubrobacteraceae bacterium MAG38_C4-C5]|nr:DUF1152 domain-containing protein [Candidatus Siliceabacter maunaloa]
MVGALAASQLAVALGCERVLGGLTWERRPVDPIPGPRRLDEATGARALNAAVALAGPDTAGPGGFRFAESHMARALGEQTVLVDPNPGPRAVGEALADAAVQLGCDLVLLVDVGGDVLGHGDEEGLASPLADAVLLAAAPAIEAAGVATAAAVFGAGCDGELTPDEVLERVSEVATAGGLLGAWAPTPEGVAELERTVAAVPTEASAMAVRCARGEVGGAAIREGRRVVRLTPVGGLTFFLDCETTIGSAARCAAAVMGARDLLDADSRLRALGVATELGYESGLPSP